jgi:hypothetical protein
MKSLKYRVDVSKTKGHVYVTIAGPKFKLRGLTSISDRVTDFETKVVALHFYKKAREFGKNMPTLKYVNYACIFGGCFE